MSDRDNAESLGFLLDEEQEMIRDEVRRFCEERIAPGVRERDQSHEFPAEIIEEMGELGLLGMLVGERWGGGGFDPLTYVAVVEEVARICPSIAVTLSVTNSVCSWPIDRFGSDDVRGRVLPELASGEKLGGFGLTEPGSGSDPASLQTTARREGDEYVINGEKAWITNAGVAGYFVVLARTDVEAGKKGISAIVVPLDAPGFSVGPPEAKMGLHSSRTAPLIMQDCRVPVSNLLGEEGQGLRIALSTLDHSRLGIAAQAVGIHQRALELGLEYARDRVQFGVPIVKHQAISFSLAKMATELSAARHLTRYAAQLSERSRDAGRLAAEAKLYASEAANRACFDSLQIHGGNGYCEDYDIARLYRDVRVTTIYEGTSEMQRLVIARDLLR